jgi:uncharacterized protein YndB with AHSA1/START domain
MAAIVGSIEIARRPEDVFAYATDASRFPEWQATSCRSARRVLARSPWAPAPS